MVSRLAALFRHQGSKRAKPVHKDAPTKAVSGKAKPNKKRAKAASKDREEPKSTQALWRKFGRKWQAGPGSVVLPQQDAADRLPKKHVWLQFRSGMGCSVCAWFAERTQPEKPKDRQRRFCTKWSQFRVSSISSMQSCTIRAHAESLVHKMAWKAFCNPQLKRKWTTASCGAVFLRRPRSRQPVMSLSFVAGVEMGFCNCMLHCFLLVSWVGFLWDEGGGAHYFRLSD